MKNTNNIVSRIKILNFMVDSRSRVHRKVAMDIHNRTYRGLKGEYLGGGNIWKCSYKNMVYRRL